MPQLYPLQQEHRHLDRGSSWLQVVADSRTRVRIQADNMDQVHRNTINERNSADATVGPIPYLQSREVLKIWHDASPTGLIHGITTGPM